MTNSDLWKEEFTLASGSKGDSVMAGEAWQQVAGAGIEKVTFSAASTKQKENRK